MVIFLFVKRVMHVWEHLGCLQHVRRTFFARTGGENWKTRINRLIGLSDEPLPPYTTVKRGVSVFTFC